MGTIKTTNIEPIADNGTVTLGSSGDTFTVPSGVTVNMSSATQTGVGGANTPAFQAFLSSNQTISNNSATKITINSEVYDTASAFDTSNNRFTPQTAGKYIFYAQMTSADTQTANEFEITIKKNGTTVLMGRTTLENFCSINTTGVVDMNGSSDYVEAFSFQNSGGNAILNGHTSATFFGGYKIIE